MPTYKFYTVADQQQDEIWIYSFNYWGEVQANKYLQELHQHLQNLVDKNIPWKLLPGDIIVPPNIEVNVYLSHYERHYIFFREFSNGDIGVMSILHDAMDIPVRLKEDLFRIISKVQDEK